MADSEQSSILSRIRRMTAEVGGASDAQLLDRFVTSHDEAAFELLLWRHARLVFGICRRVLQELHDAEDAFQATFLALARHAGRIGKREAVASWLQKVAYRTALTARMQRARRQAREKLHGPADSFVPSQNVAALAENEELRCHLDQEISRLPERFRAPVVLCYLEGKSVDEAALVLGCPRGTVASRLARARERLRVRLAGRGLALTAALALLNEANAFPRPLALLPALRAAALRYAAGGAVAKGTLAPHIIALTEEVLLAMFLDKLKIGTVMVIAFLGILLAGGGVVVGLRAPATAASEPPATAQVSQPPPKAREEPDKAGEALGKKEDQKIVVTSPRAKDVAITQLYVCKILSHHRINICAQANGHLTETPVKEGQAVKKGDVMFKILPTIYQAKLDVELAALRIAQIEFNNVKKLFETKVVSDIELALSQAKLAKAQAQANIAEAELSFTMVRAPFDGLVGRLQMQQGSLVKAGDTLTTLSDNSVMSVYFNLPETRYLEYMADRDHDKDGWQIELVLANGSKFPHPGKLGAIEAEFNQQSGNIPFRADFPNPNRLLRHGQSGTVWIHRTVKNALVIPQRAVFEVLAKRFVYVVGKDGVVHQREIDIQHELEDTFVIKKGLDVNDRIVLDGVRQVRDGEKVAYEFRKPEEVMANPKNHREK